jgi:hypothetical protein
MMALLQSDGEKVWLAEAPESCRPRFLRYLAEGINFPEFMEQSKYNVSPSDPDFLRKLVPGVKAMWGVEAEVTDG